MSGRLIQEKAAVLATAIGHDDFTASNGWLDRWKTRHNVRCSVLNGESADVPEGAVADWSVRLPAICDGYAAKDIFRTCYAVLSQTPHERPPRFYDHPNVILRVVVKEGFYCSYNEVVHWKKIDYTFHLHGKQN